MTVFCPKLPKRLENDPRHAAVMGILGRDPRGLGRQGRIEVPSVVLSQMAVTAIRRAWMSGFVVRGIEDAVRFLDNERRGIEIARRRASQAAGGRVSRLAFVTNDGSDRFYRGVESLLREHTPRLMVLLVNEDARTFSREIFSRGRLCRFVMVTHKDALSEVLIALADETPVDEAAG